MAAVVIDHVIGAVLRSYGVKWMRESANKKLAINRKTVPKRQEKARFSEKWHIYQSKQKSRYS